MIQTLTKNRWLLALCGLLDAIISAIYFLIADTDGSLTSHAWHGTVVWLGRLAMVAGACTIAAGIWRSGKGKCWLLVLNGLALFTLGLIYDRLIRYSISFRTIALLISVMAISIGILELLVGDRLLFMAGVTSLGFALAFLGFVFRWIQLDPGSPAQTLLWLGSYFACSAMCKLALAQRLHGPGFGHPAHRAIDPGSSPVSRWKPPPTAPTAAVLRSSPVS